jgi:hypothetical protein
MRADGMTEAAAAEAAAASVLPPQERTRGGWGGVKHDCWNRMWAMKFNGTSRQGRYRWAVPEFKGDFWLCEAVCTLTLQRSFQPQVCGASNRPP